MTTRRTAKRSTETRNEPKKISSPFLPLKRPINQSSLLSRPSSSLRFSFQYSRSSSSFGSFCNQRDRLPYPRSPDVPSRPGNCSACKQQISVKGELFKSIQHWRSLGTPDSYILSVIRNGYKILFISTPPPRRFSNNASALNREAILELLRATLVEEMISPPDIVNPLTVPVQGDGLDLRHINLHIYKQKFKCENLHTIRTFLPAKAFLFSLLI